LQSGETRIRVAHDRGYSSWIVDRGSWIVNRGCLFDPRFTYPISGSWIVHRQDEDFAVADLPGLRRAGGVDDGLDGSLNEGVVDGDFQFQLGQQTHGELGTAIHLRVAA